ncbi:hypothetical protein ACQ4PT_035909 [Festuca glaucescens]
MATPIRRYPSPSSPNPWWTTAATHGGWRPSGTDTQPRRHFFLSTSLPSHVRLLSLPLVFMPTASDWQQDHEIGKKIKRESASEAGRMMAARRSSSLPTAGAGPGSAPSFNMMTPCAACKLLRRRCAQECTFSPFFSPMEPHKFASVHKVFGASNVAKMLLEVHESQRSDAANSLVYEANLRLRDPVYGCMGAIITLQQQVHALEAELAGVRAEITKHSTAICLRSRERATLLARIPAPRCVGSRRPTQLNRPWEWASPLWQGCGFRVVVDDGVRRSVELHGLQLHHA